MKIMVSKIKSRRARRFVIAATLPITYGFLWLFILTWPAAVWFFRAVLFVHAWASAARLAHKLFSQSVLDQWSNPLDGTQAVKVKINDADSSDN